MTRRHQQGQQQQQQKQPQTDGDADTLKIFLTTDNHVGYKENDPILGDDSAVTFHEIMMLAKHQDADMILQSGDLFHVNKPSKQSMYQVMRSLRLACLGDKPCEVQVLNHGRLGLEPEFDHVNYEDPNYNVAIPVFAISGNHDDSGGSAVKLSPMDVLSISGLVNYYGRVVENDNITVTPVLMKKGSTKVALYGISNVRDERLHRTFRDGKVKFLRPSEDTDSWFNIICVHQNHISHSETNYLPENFLPDFMDVVIWGHEHECRISPLHNAQQGFQVIQPGSSVATSLSESEAVPKYVGMLKVRGKTFKLDKFRLKTVRPFAMNTIYLSEELPNDRLQVKKGDIIRHMVNKVEELIEEARNKWLEAREGIDAQEVEWLHELSQSARLHHNRGNKRAKTIRISSSDDGDFNDGTDREDEFSNLNMAAVAEDEDEVVVNTANGYKLSDKEENDVNACPLPLIRLRVEYSGGFEVENATRFSNRFVGRVANVNEIVHYFRKKRTGAGAGAEASAGLQWGSTKAQSTSQDVDMEKGDDEENGELSKFQVQQLIEDYLKEAELNILKQEGLDDAMHQFIDKDEKQALKDFVDETLADKVKELMQKGYKTDEELLKSLNLVEPGVPSVKKPGAKRRVVTGSRTGNTKPAKATDLGKASTPARRSTRARKPVSQPVVVDSDSDDDYEEAEVNDDDRDYGDRRKQVEFVPESDSEVDGKKSGPGKSSKSREAVNPRQTRKRASRQETSSEKTQSPTKSAQPVLEVMEIDSDDGFD